MSNTATVITYDGSTPRKSTGRIVRKYPTGAIVVEDRKGVIYYATPDRILSQNESHAPPRVNQAQLF
jgi:hypothetical protein